MLRRAPSGQHSWWSDRDYRRDLLIVVGLFCLGLLFNLIVALAVVMLFDLFALWDVVQALDLEWASQGPTGHRSGV